MVRRGPRRLADPPVLEALAAHAAITIDNALFYAKRSADVAALQHGLLPASLPAVPVFELAAYYAPGDRSLEVGGDFYDAVSLAADHVALVIGDVCGSGADAASLTGPARAVLRTVLEDGASPARALARLNHAMFDFNDDVKFCKLLSGYLESQGFTIGVAHDGAAALQLTKEAQWDLMVLDVMMPGIDGFEVLSLLRRGSEVPVLMLTGRGTENDLVRGLSAFPPVDIDPKKVHV